eukprot:scaffold58515_cov18-Tisochrysis_lutea.AAC.2
MQKAQPGAAAEEPNPLHARMQELQQELREMEVCMLQAEMCRRSCRNRRRVCSRHLICVWVHRIDRLRAVRGKAAGGVEWNGVDGRDVRVTTQEVQEREVGADNATGRRHPAWAGGS